MSTTRNARSCTGTLGRLIDQRLLPATQVAACAPWEIPVESLQDPAVLKAVENVKQRVRARQAPKNRMKVHCFQISDEVNHNVAASGLPIKIAPAPLAMNSRSSRRRMRGFRSCGSCGV